jgi:hypothetical protein
MKPIVAIIASLLLLSPALVQLPVPKPPGPGGSCPHGYTSCGPSCVPRAGAEDAIPLPPNGSCPHGWTRSAAIR